MKEMKEIKVPINVNNRETKITNSKEKIIEIKKDDVNEILRASYFAENTIHIVKIKNSKECINDDVGTSFIYKQMVFNMIYDKFGNSNSTAKEKINNLISWIYDNTSNINNIIFTITDKDLEKIENIITDKTIRQSKKDEFISIMKKINNDTLLSIDEISKIFIFINDVRNNFFHGTKKAQDALEKGQNERLEMYSKFLSKLSLEFFSIIRNKGMVLSDSSLEDDLKENLGLLKR